RLRGRMEHDLRLESGDDIMQRGCVTDVDSMERRTPRNVGRRSPREVVHHAHAVAVRQQAIDEVRADEPRSTRHQRAHTVATHGLMKLPRLSWTRKGRRLDAK